MIEIKILQNISWNRVGDKSYARLILPNDVVERSFLININKEKISANYIIQNDGNVIIELKSE